MTDTTNGRRARDGEATLAARVRLAWLCACAVGATMGGALPESFRVLLVLCGVGVGWHALRTKYPTQSVVTAGLTFVSTHTVGGFYGGLGLMYAWFGLSAAQSGSGRAPFFLLAAATTLAYGATARPPHADGTLPADPLDPAPPPAA